MADDLRSWSDESSATTHEDTTEADVDAEVVAGDADLVRALTAGPAAGAGLPPHVLAAMHQRFGNGFVADLLARRAGADMAPAAAAPGVDEAALEDESGHDGQDQDQDPDQDQDHDPDHDPDHDAPARALSQVDSPGAVARAPRPEHAARPAEPLDMLKEMSALPSARNLRGLLRLIAHAPARARLGLRTPLSRQDGLTTIVTAFVMRAAMRQFRAAGPGARKKLQRIIGNHLRLSNTPLGAGGLRVAGVGGGALTGLAGPTSNGFSVETVNQTAVMLVTLHQLRRDPAFAAHRPVVRGQWARFEPEFRALLLRCYPPGQHPRTWRYGVSPDRPSYHRHEDQSHLKTTYQQLRRLVELEAPNAPWCQQQADRLEAAYPLVNAPWEDLGSHDGSIR